MKFRWIVLKEEPGVFTSIVVVFKRMLKNYWDMYSLVVGMPRCVVKWGMRRWQWVYYGVVEKEEEIQDEYGLE